MKKLTKDLAHLEYDDMPEGYQLGWNPMRLPARVAFEVRYPQQGMQRIKALLDERRHRGLRLRYGILDSNHVSVEARSYSAIYAAKEALRGLLK